MTETATSPLVTIDDERIKSYLRVVRGSVEKTLNALTPAKVSPFS
jgi:hypothetical protein